MCSGQEQPHVHLYCLHMQQSVSLLSSDALPCGRGPVTCLLDLVLGADGAPDAQLINGTEEVLCAILLVLQGIQLAICSCTHQCSDKAGQDSTDLILWPSCAIHFSKS